MKVRRSFLHSLVAVALALGGCNSQFNILPGVAGNVDLKADVKADIKGDTADLKDAANAIGSGANDGKLDKISDQLGGIDKKLDKLAEEQKELIASFKELKAGMFEFLGRGQGFQVPGSTGDVAVVPLAQAKDIKTNRLVIAGQTADGRRGAWARNKPGRKVQGEEASASIEVDTWEQLSLQISSGSITSRELDHLINGDQSTFRGNDAVNRVFSLLTPEGIVAFFRWPGWLAEGQMPPVERLPELLAAGKELYAMIRPLSTKDQFLFQERKLLPKYHEDGTVAGAGRDLDHSGVLNGAKGRVESITFADGVFSLLLKDGDATPSLLVVEESAIGAERL